MTFKQKMSKKVYATASGIKLKQHFRKRKSQYGGPLGYSVMNCSAPSRCVEFLLIHEIINSALQYKILRKDCLCSVCDLKDKQTWVTHQENNAYQQVHLYTS